MNQKPNLLIIHTDQQSWWTLGCYGGTLVHTPNIDRIAREGVRFTNFFTNSALCTPSRGCFITGRYPHCHGAYTNNVPLNRDEITFAYALKAHGYATGYGGKWHLDGTPRPGWVHPERTMGFDHAECMFNRGHWKKIEDGLMGDMQATVYPYRVIGDAKTYATDWLTSKTTEFIERSWQEPFCFMVSIPDPHGPVWVRPPYDTMFRPEDMSLPTTLTDEHLPDWARAAQEGSPFGMGKPDREERLRRFMALYCGEVKLIDDCVGRILDSLQQQAILDRTIVVFTTDHGEYAGEHGLQGKNELYETAYRIPLVMRWPEKIGARTVVENIVSTVDFQPTILGLMGVEPCGREQGRDAGPLIRGDGVDWEDCAFLHHCSHDRAGVFTDRFELAYVREGESVLFDRDGDPDQTRNLFTDPTYGDVVRALGRRILDHHVALSSPAAKWLREV